VRVAWHQPVDGNLAPRIDFNLVGSLGQPDQLHATLDLGARFSIPRLARQPHLPTTRLETCRIQAA
jgi:hypothetical protein